MQLTFLTHDENGTLRLLKHTPTSDTPNVEEEWEKAKAEFEDKLSFMGSLSLVGAMTVSSDQKIRWYPDVDDSLEAQMAGRVLH